MKKTRTKASCERCGLEYERTPHQIKKSIKRYCGMVCAGLSRRGKANKNNRKVVKSCLVCSKVFYVFPYRENSAKTCSRKCAINVLGNAISEHYDGKRKLHKNKKSGYLYISFRGKYFPHHRFVVEQALGRSLKENEQVHHKNGIRDDNRVENLQIMDLVEHAKLSAMQRWGKRKYATETIH
jgi:hypothetical protein